MMKVVGRKNKRVCFALIGVFTMVMVFSFLVLRFKNGDKARAADLGKFNPGYIISDFQMGDYTSMSEAEIQNFLTSKNSCGNTNYGYYQQLATNPNYRWHFENGHFICLSEERFGNNDNEIGFQYGETAAHIIWQAAQDFRINPKVILVLLQKETGLITDPIPNNGDYRKATGYGCPDTAACSSQYYGFKNQVRNAVALFRAVLDGGWTNYPLGENYVQYNPNAACGGSVINIQNRATSALYRYTPYQPNAGALAAGYGTAPCGAYGNRNFYLYFEDWFGNIVGEGGWETMKSPRIMKVKQATLKVNPFTKTTYNEWAQTEYKYYFASKKNVYWGGNMEVCLRTAEDTINNVDRCIIMSRMEDTNEKVYNTIGNSTEYLLVNSNTNKYSLETGQIAQNISLDQYYAISFSEKVTYNDVLYYRTTHDLNNAVEAFIPASAVKEIGFVDFKMPRNMKVEEGKFVNLKTGENCKKVNNGFIGKFATKLDRGDGTFYRLEDDNNNTCAIKADYVGEAENVGVVSNTRQFVNFINPRNMRQKKSAYLVDLNSGKTCEYVNEGSVKKYTTKIDIEGVPYFRSEEGAASGSYCAMRASMLGEV